MFVDKVKIKVEAGKGGDGIVAFIREKYIPKGGPGGGDGGKGGDIIFYADSGLSTLLDLRYNKVIKATDGSNGEPKNCHGKSASDTLVKVPCGTVIKDAQTGNVIADLKEHGQRAVVAKGGRGGRGNSRFASSRMPAPKICENGEPGQKRELALELMVLADAGLVGFPSVGKSTFISVVSNARPEIAAYHFTTITPKLGMVRVPDGRSFVLADLPGLIEGASQGKGLGHHFLRHIERCRVIVHVIDMSGWEGRDPIEDYKIINEELKSYKLRLQERPQVVVANKMDMEGADENLAKFRAAYPDLQVYEVSTISKMGLDAVVYKVADILEKEKEVDIFADEEKAKAKAYYKYEIEVPYTIELDANGVWVIGGDKVTRIYQMNPLNTDENIRRFTKALYELGVEKALIEKGAQNGDTVRIGSFEFELYI